MKTAFGLRVLQLLMAASVAARASASQGVPKVGYHHSNLRLLLTQAYFLPFMPFTSDSLSLVFISMAERIISQAPNIQTKFANKDLVKIL